VVGQIESFDVNLSRNSFKLRGQGEVRSIVFRLLHRKWLGYECENLRSRRVVWAGRKILEGFMEALSRQGEKQSSGLRIPPFGELDV
jgi:hypothetical protein